MTTDSTRTLVLHERHKALGARMAPFAGYQMPIRYGTIVEEHKAVRTSGGLFDVSHMGQIFVRGSEALKWLDSMVPRDMLDFPLWSAKYTMVLTPEGGIIDDIIVYRLAEDELMACVNASNRQEVFEWFKEHESGDVEVVDDSDSWGLLALQGPKVRALAADWIGDAANLKPFQCAWAELDGAKVLVACTGYTGEDGFEFYIPTGSLEAVWDKAISLGDGAISPVGLGARDTLRLESRFHLHGNEIHKGINPIEAGLGWTIAWDSTGYIGEEALRKIKEQGPSRKLTGVVLPKGGILRAGYPLMIEGEKVGELTSGSVAPSLDGISIGLAYIRADLWREDSAQVEIRGRLLDVQLTRKPFYRRPEA